jgi:hypothetical protein
MFDPITFKALSVPSRRAAPHGTKRPPLPSTPGIRYILDVAIDSLRKSDGKAIKVAGKAVIIDPFEVDINLHFELAALTYDFNESALTRKLAQKMGKIYRPVGYPLREIVARYPGAIFASDGQTDQLLANNNAMVKDGRLYTRITPGVQAKTLAPLNGRHTFFVFDPGKIGLIDVVFENGQPVNNDTINFRNGFNGPVLIREGKRQDDQLIVAEKDQPNNRPNELLWDHTTRPAAQSAVGIVEQNGRKMLVFVALKGDPKKDNECLVADLVDVLLKLKVSEAMLLGVSGDVQQFVQHPDPKNAWLIARPRPGSSLALQGDRPLAIAIVATKK